MNFAGFQEAMLLVFYQPTLWMLALLVAGGVFTSIFILWLQLIRVMGRIAA